MPFNKIQAVLKKVLPKSYFNFLYNVACDTYVAYWKVIDRTFYIPSYIGYKILGNTKAANRVETVTKVLPHTMVCRAGVLVTYDIAFNLLNKVDGCFVECGVARGGCSAVMAMMARNEGRNRKTWMFDTFEGLPPQTVEDGVQRPPRHNNRKAMDLVEGYCLGLFEEVDYWIFSELKLSRDNVFIVKGLFQDTLPVYKNNIGSIAILRLDGDWYASTKCCLENLYHNIVPGGYAILDDYHVLAGCKLAVDEFLATITPKPLMLHDKNGRTYFKKP